MEEFGASHEQLAACLSLVMMRDKSYSKVVMLSAAVANEYRIRMLPSPTTHETISTLFRGFQNEHQQTRTAKLPITEEILDKFYTSTKLNMGDMGCVRLLFCGAQFGEFQWSIILLEGLAISSSCVGVTSNTLRILHPI